MWRTLRVRGAGFPASDLLALAAPEAAAAVDQLLVETARVDTARASAIEACERTVASLPIDQRKPFHAALKRMRNQRAPEPFDAPPDVQAALATLADTERAHTERKAIAGLALEDSRVRASAKLRAVAQDPRFREAMRWQNAAFVNLGIDSLLRRPPETNDKTTRKIEATVASYLQRYCAKNDTIGFFGPVGWGTFADQTRLVPGPTLLAERTVFFEYWGIDALAATLADDPALKPLLAPRRMPTVWVDGTTLHHPVARTSELPDAYARLLAACDAERPAYVIAEELVADESLELSGVDEVYELLGELVEKKLATWTIELPPDSPRPDRALRDLLDGAGDAGQRGLAALDALEARRHAVAEARGSDVELAGAFGELEATFTELTAAAATRNAGQTYAGRTLVYEDCQRDIEFTLGPEQCALFGPALTLVLQSARWYTYTIAERYRRVFVEAYRALCTEHGTTAIDYFRFWERIEPHFGGNPRSAPPLVREVADELQRRWLDVLGGPFTDRRVDLAAQALQPAVAAAFAAPHPGWASARYHSPDVMVAARSVEAMQHGDVTYVLGEVHVGVNTIAVQVFLNQYPEPERVFDWMTVDLPDPRILPVVPKARANRASDLARRPVDLDLETGSGKSGQPRSHVIAVGEVTVQELDGRLCVCVDERSFDCIEFFENFLRVESLSHFNLLPPLPHAPRITIDKLVVSRERWTFTPDELAFAHGEVATERYLEMRRWAQRHDLPRLLFYKVPEEPKPCYLDLESPTYVDMFLKLVRKATKVHVSEMLPAFDDCWLTDAEGHRYTTELRMVAVDPQPWPASWVGTNEAP